MKRQDGYLTRKSGSWLGHYSVWIMDPASGRKKRRQKCFKIGPASMTKTAAKNKLRERLVKELGVTGDFRMTMGAFIETQWKPMREGTWRDSTKAVNRELLKFVVDRFGTTALEDMDTVEMQVWLNDLASKKSGSLVRHCRNFLQSILREATEREFLRRDPGRMLRLPRLRPVAKPYLTVEQLTALIEEAACYPRDYTLLTVMALAAFRPSELFALTWDCVDMVNNTITIKQTVYRGQFRPFTKNTEEGDRDYLTAYLPEPAMMALVLWCSEAKYNEPTDFVFPNSEGGYITKENYQKRVLNPLAKMAGIPKVNFQILRRTVATHAQQYGSPKDVSVILRHKKVETAQLHYVQAVTATVKETENRLAEKILPSRHTLPDILRTLSSGHPR